MTPDFRVIAADQDVTELIKDRLKSLTIIDEDGQKADRLRMVLDDRKSRLELPETDASLDISLGFKGQSLSYIGRYTVDQIGGSGPQLEMTIGATAANMTGAIRAPKTRSWEDVSLADIVSQIAAAADLKLVVGKSLESVRYAYLAQTSESDLHFLTRLARDLDATAKPAAGTLLVQKRGEGLNAQGKKIEPVKISPSQLSRWTWDLEEREAYKTVEAEWGDIDGAKMSTVKVGSGDPVRRLRHTYATQDEAKRAADADLALSGRAVINANFELAGFHPALFAGGQSEINGLRPEFDGVWHVERVEHTLQESLKTQFKARFARD